MDIRGAYHTIVDFRNRPIRLYEHTLEHIRQSHPEIGDPLAFVTDILKSPVIISEDELPDTEIYHKRAKKLLMHVAYVQVVKNFVKSAHISDKIKGGAVKWFAETKDIFQ
jgi:hypothetical protein